MPYRMLEGAGVRGNPNGSKTRYLKRGEIVEPNSDHEAEDLRALAEAGIAEEVEARSVSAPENKMLQGASDKKNDGAGERPDGAACAIHKGAGRWQLLDREGNPLGGFYAKEQVEAWGLR